MSATVEDIVQAQVGANLAQMLFHRVQTACDEGSEVGSRYRPTGQSRQTIGSVRRLAFFHEIEEYLYPLAGRISINDSFAVVGAHDEPVTVDLLKVGSFYLHFTRVNEGGRFVSSLSSTIKEFVKHAEAGRPLFPDLDKPLVLVLYYVLDADRVTVNRVGIGVASGDFTRIERDVIPDLLVYASQLEATAVEDDVDRSTERSHGVTLRGPEGESPEGDSETPGTKVDN